MAPGVYLNSNRNDYQKIIRESKAWRARETEKLAAISRLDSVGSSTYHNLIGLYGLLQG
jgi:hypothetical protein